MWFIKQMMNEVSPSSTSHIMLIESVEILRYYSTQLFSEFVHLDT